MASTSPDANCHARCHQTCNDFTWKCPQHGTGIAKITIPSPPVYEFPSRSSAAGKPCSVCQNPLCCRYADLAYSCANLSCDNVCHLVATYSCFVNPRGTARARILSTQIWHCHLHSSTSEVYNRVISDSLFTCNFQLIKKDTCKMITSKKHTHKTQIFSITLFHTKKIITLKSILTNLKIPGTIFLLIPFSNI